MQRVFVLFSIVSMFALSGCGGVHSDFQEKKLAELCERMFECREVTDVTSVENCMLVMGAMQLSIQCIDASIAAPCEEHEKVDVSYLELCWEKCEGEWQVCRGDLLAQCANGWEWIHFCDRSCYELNGEYSGTCGRLAPDGQTTSEVDTCWCTI